MFSSLRVPNFRLYAGGQILSLLGIWVQRITQEWLVLDISGGSAVALGIAVALQFLPVLVFTLWAGVLADRYDKRRMLIRLQYGIGACALVLGLLDTSGLVRLWHVYTLCVILGFFNALEMPTRQSFVTEMVGDDRVGNAVALNSVIVNSARIAGPALAGYLITWIGTGWLFLFNAASVAVATTALLLMDPAKLRPNSRQPRTRGELAAGIDYARRRPDLVVVLALVFCLGTFGNTFNTTLAVIATQVFALGSDGFGLFHAMLAVGTFSGAAAAAWRSGRRKPRLRLLVGSAFAFGAFEIVAGLMPTAVSFGAALVVIGAAQMTFILTANNIIQLSVDVGLRGRVMGLYMLLLLGGVPLGNTLSGWLAELVDPRAPLWTGGFLVAFAALCCARHLRRRKSRGLVAGDRGE